MARSQQAAQRVGEQEQGIPRLRRHSESTEESHAGK